METMTGLTGLFDVFLSAGLLWLAWQALASTDLFRAIVLFISFGLLMALAWARLGAPDIALAEAAIGAGLTGALLLSALARLPRDVPAGDAGCRTAFVVRVLAWLATMGLASTLAWVVFHLQPVAPGPGNAVIEQLEASGVGNPVTAVLLNFRGYDTLLEMAVLLLALLGVWSLGVEAEQQVTGADPVLDGLARLLLPLLILVAAYLLWVGAHAPGGAFQAGSVLGAAGVLLLLAGWRLRAAMSSAWMRAVLVAGPAAFVAMAVTTLLIEGRLLEFPQAQAGMLIFVLEACATLSIGATLAALYLGGIPQAEDDA